MPVVKGHRNASQPAKRGTSFESVVAATDQGGLVEVLEQPNPAARNTFNKTNGAKLRVTEPDFNLAHARAREEGVPYQTLLSSVIRKYLSGRLTDRT